MVPSLRPSLGAAILSSRSSIPLLALAALVVADPPDLRTTTLVDDLSRAAHAGASGYLDLFQANSLRPRDRVTRPYGELEGYVQRRRLAAWLQDPDSLAPLRLGLVGAWDQGGWTDDSYFASASGAHEERTSWLVGLAAAWPSTRFVVLGGVGIREEPRWVGLQEDEFLAPSRATLFLVTRKDRMAGAAVVGTHGLNHARIGFQPTTSPLPSTGTFISPQLEAAANWSTADWNPWGTDDAWGVALGAPLWRDRIALRAEAGSEGFRQARIECDLSSEGVLGFDVSYSRDRKGRRHPGIRVRIPLFTLGWNDPEDNTALGMDGSVPVWSARLQMTWEGPETYYRPGRRPSPPEAR